MIISPKENKMIREDLIYKICALLGLEFKTLPWATLCRHTEFDSFATALAFGFNWQDENMETMPESNLKMALFNIENFPKKSK